MIKKLSGVRVNSRCGTLLFSAAFLCTCLSGCENIEFQWNGHSGHVKAREVPGVAVSTPTIKSVPSRGDSARTVALPVPESGRKPLEKAMRIAKDNISGQFFPFQGEAVISIIPSRQWVRVSRENFLQFRKDSIKEHEVLHIFPVDYDPFRDPHLSLYAGLDFSLGWTDFSKSVVSNPYLLVMLSRPVMYTSFQEDCGLSAVRYRCGVIEETYSGNQAIQFFDILEQGGDTSRSVSIWTINAEDAGFAYAALDREQCANVDFKGDSTSGYVPDTVYNLHAVYDALSYRGVNVLYNNIVPAGGTVKTFTVLSGGEWGKAGEYVPGNQPAQIKIRLKETRRNTCIFIKLWKNKPANIDAKEDIAYRINVIF